MGWLDGWERIEIPGRAGGNYTGDEPWRCVLHSTEGLSIESAVGAYTTGGVPPTTTIDPAARRKAQHIDTNRSAYAVMNQPGGVETNRWRAIQVEIVMFADQTKAQQYGGLYVGDLTDEHYAFIRACLLELQADKPFTFDGPDFIHYPDSYGRTQYRMSFGEWEAFGGTCGHQHVPENDHGDPGELDRARLFFQGADMPLTDDDLEKIKVAVWERSVPSPLDGRGYPARDHLNFILTDAHATRAAVATLMAKLDPEKFAEAVAAKIPGVSADQLEAAFKDVLREGTG